MKDYMQIRPKTSLSKKSRTYKMILKISLPFVVIIGLIYLLDQIELTIPNKIINKEIPNEKLITLK